MNDGGPAFPSEQGYVPHGVWNKTYEPGMSLRDWFAGKAMASIMTNGIGCSAVIAGAKKYGTTTCEHCALIAYQQADAMIAESTKKEEPCQTKT